MIILYIPFPRILAGDLSSLVNQWQVNHQKNSKEPLIIIYQGEDFDQDLIEPLSSVYICAHGYRTQHLEVGNNAKLAVAQCINMLTLAERFTNDLLPVVHCLAKVHLYCCGIHEKNKVLANLFKTHLLRTSFHIFFYNGNITIPDVQGQRWSFGAAGATYVDNTISSVHHISSNDGGEVFTDRLSIKDRDLLFWRENARLNRIDKYLEQQKKRRHEKFSLFRGLSRKAESEASGEELNKVVDKII
ncbi:hypothetical protein [Legionella sp. km772]|uniref:hypothetical protein n=1 Tax=Legionella sp. km772 TaxID=2498111 RepID=UPI000F8EB078|nr:hypothetical protein [Legionella sp. km772]RUR06983.1 hypothetical protein ELY15_12665 [Legionella sp. km772]